MRDIAEALGIGPTSVYTHISSKAELLQEIVIDTLDAILAIQSEAITSTSDVVQQLRRAAESQVRYFVENPKESLIAIREFRWAEGDRTNPIGRGGQSDGTKPIRGKWFVVSDIQAA